MKKLIYVLAVMALVLAGCKSTAYKIEGSVKNVGQDGDFVYMKERINKVWSSIDSVKITDGKFSFVGECDSARVVYVFVENADGEEIREPLVLENGNIQLTIDTAASKVTGTAQNDILQKYMEAKKAMMVKADEIYKNFDDSTATDAERKALEQKMMAIEKEITEFDIQFATENVNTVVGNFVFISSSYSMNIEQKEKIIALMNAETKESTRIVEMIESIAIEKNTSAGKKYTDFSLPNLQGETESLSSLIGKTDYVLVDFWASWCGPCMQSLPELKALYAAYGGAKLEIVGVSLDSDSTAWQATIKAKELKWKHVSDLQGWKSAGAALYAVRAIPATVLIDKAGTIVGRNLTATEIEKILSTRNK
ncbi:MAG: AhpC/TSA family protein [Paludibacter sp.]|nr:AhpC/TSA family protein [Paludibacter sp.]